MKKRAGAVSFIAVTIILVLVAAYFCAETVKCRTDVSAQEMEAFYLEKEEELVAETRAFLKKEGYENSGVMLTRVVDADGGRQYTMTVHHGRINALGEAERQALLEKLECLSFAGENITFFHEFLTNQ